MRELGAPLPGLFEGAIAFANFIYQPGHSRQIGTGEVVVLYLYRPQMQSQPQVASSTSLGFFIRF